MSDRRRAVLRWGSLALMSVGAEARRDGCVSLTRLTPREKGNRDEGSLAEVCEVSWAEFVPVTCAPETGPEGRLGARVGRDAGGAQM